MRGAIFAGGVSALSLAAAAALITAGVASGDSGLLRTGVALAALGGFAVCSGFVLALLNVLRA